ncbi:nuclear transport factor 2 family protein [Dyella sp. EPa41]|uniref:nuclear transport factor 2 family protein n=1 Tax=Dyella sp. EPa41 TaxID=1561194 RepID=UPI0019158D3D|nr:nuclear transport factor 2 family protein [Dyella sp. EPa41]
MTSHVIRMAVLALALMRTGAAFADDMPAKDGATAQWMIAKERAWANMACGGEWVASEILANDFQGTAPKGLRYGKPASAPAYDPKTPWSTDCRLDSADVRFFSADVAVVYGSESKTVALPDSSHERRCLVWTDMWMRRNGKWQIIAVQDNRVDCPAK